MKIELEKYTREISLEWDFKEADTKEYTHSYHNYPAMMIPQIARKLITDFSPNDKLELIFDPYMGSGTTLVESKIKGINAIGTDINPLARLISKVKTTDYDIITIEDDFKILKSHIEIYESDKIDLKVNITNPFFWYKKESLQELQFLTNLISQLVTEHNKEFFLISLSECIREVSYTRNSEFKRYRMSAEQMEKFSPKTFKLFTDKIKRNITGLKQIKECNSKSKISINSFNTVYEIPQDIIKYESVDMIVTSPPYGDSKTTVAYGQFSRWANEWFDFENAKNLDNLLMGGKKINTSHVKTKSIAVELDKIKEIDLSRYMEVMSFLDDYSNSIANVSKTVRKGGSVCYVVGNRTVKGIQIPLDYFTAEMFENNGFKHITTIVRKIPNKRMPSKTSPTNIKGQNVSTMINEYIVILNKV